MTTPDTLLAALALVMMFVGSFGLYGYAARRLP